MFNMLIKLQHIHTERYMDMSEQDITENILWKNHFVRDRKKRKNNIAPCEVGKTCKYHRIMAQ